MFFYNSRSSSLVSVTTIKAIPWGRVQRCHYEVSANFYWTINIPKRHIGCVSRHYLTLPFNLHPNNQHWHRLLQYSELSHRGLVKIEYMKLSLLLSFSEELKLHFG